MPTTISTSSGTRPFTGAPPNLPYAQAAPMAISQAVMLAMKPQW